MKISMVMITRNEEERLSATLDSCAGIADELVVVDSLSTDRTTAIAKEYGARVYSRPFNGFAAQKNFALDQAQYPWVLSLDADEHLSPELREELQALKHSGPGDISGFYLPRKTFYLGRWIHHSGWYPQAKLRLFRNQGARWQGRIHERLILQGKKQQLTGALLHYTYRDIADHARRINHYSSLQAQDGVEKGKSWLWLRFVLQPPMVFFRHYLLKQGVLDGFPGLVIAVLSAYGVALRHAKAIAMRRGLCGRNTQTTEL